MPTIQTFEHFTAFVDHNKNFLEENILLHFFPLSVFGEFTEMNKSPEIYINIVDGNHSMLVFRQFPLCLTYGNGFTPAMIQVLSDYIDFSEMRGFDYAGNVEILQRLFAKHNLQYHPIKQRIIYRCFQPILPAKKVDGQLENANMSALDHLTKMGVAFSNDYGEPMSRTQMYKAIKSSLELGDLYVWKIKGKISGMITVLFPIEETPTIGLFYTEPFFRNKGIGAAMLYEMTRILIEEDEFEAVWLSADAFNPASNAVFNKQGYHRTGEFLKAKK